MSLTILFIDKDWKLVSLCLQKVYFPEDHMGEATAAGSFLRTLRGPPGLHYHRQRDQCHQAAKLNGWTRLQCLGHRLNFAIEKVKQDN
ncbi:hypothetical protein SRHO_G00146030 [Serrasalmus rhombeus]